MSHELRTPLNAIIGYSEILSEEAEDEGLDSFVEDLGKIRKAGRQLLEIIQNILDLSKMETGRLELAFEPFEPASIIEEVVGMAEPLLRKNHNQLEVRVEGELGTMVGDPTRVRQALFHLVSNAAKFTEQGHLSVQAERSCQEQESWVVFRVRDEGIGMTDEQIRKVFVPFQQADSSCDTQVWRSRVGAPPSPSRFVRRWEARSRCKAQSARAQPSRCGCPRERSELRFQREHHRATRHQISKRMTLQVIDFSTPSMLWMRSRTIWPISLKSAPWMIATRS